MVSTKDMIAEGVLDNIDAIFGMHILHMYPTRVVVLWELRIFLQFSFMIE
jgi:metal-dependent amidase/aminoacylase/carboxypeptidase family protein